MKDMTSSMWIVLEGKPEKEGIDLICAGYNYNNKRVLVFVIIRGAESTKVGELH